MVAAASLGASGKSVSQPTWGLPVRFRLSPNAIANTSRAMLSWRHNTFRSAALSAMKHTSRLAGWLVPLPDLRRYYKPVRPRPTHRYSRLGLSVLVLLP
jgi:hypothetical protein